MTIETVKLIVQADAHSVPVGETEPAERDGGRANLIAWRSAVEAMSDVDAVLMLGDMTELYSGATDVAGLLTGMANTYAIFGNHDIAIGAGGDKSEQKDALRNLYGMPANYYAFDVGFVRVIMLDSCYVGETSESFGTGHLPSAELAWLENELDSLDATRPMLIGMHHTTWPASASTPTYFNSTSADALAALIAGRPNTWVLAGHRHPSAMTIDALSGRPVFTIRALCDERYSIVTIERRCGSDCRIQVVEQTVTP